VKPPTSSPLQAANRQAPLPPATMNPVLPQRQALTAVVPIAKRMCRLQRRCTPRIRFSIPGLRIWKMANATPSTQIAAPNTDGSTTTHRIPGGGLRFPATEAPRKRSQPPPGASRTSAAPTPCTPQRTASAAVSTTWKRASATPSTLIAAPNMVGSTTMHRIPGGGSKPRAKIMKQTKPVQMVLFSTKVPTQA